MDQAKETDELSFQLYTKTGKQRAFYMRVSCGLILELDFFPKTGGGFQRLTLCCSAPAQIPLRWDFEKSSAIPLCTACDAEVRFVSTYTMVKDYTLEALLFGWLEEVGLTPLRAAAATGLVESQIFDTYRRLQEILTVTGWASYPKSDYIPIEKILLEAFPSIEIASGDH